MSFPNAPPPTPSASHQQLAAITDQICAFTKAHKHSSLLDADVPTTPPTTPPSPKSPRRPLEHHVAYRDAPLTSLPATAAPLMSGVTAKGLREPSQHRTTVYPFQRYFVANRVRDSYRTTNVYIPLTDYVCRPPPPEQQQQSFLNQSPTAFLIDKHFDTPIAYTICVADQPPLLTVQRTTITDVWDVYNGTLFSDIQPAIALGKVHTFMSVVDNVMFAFVPHTRVLVGVPSMQMEPHTPNSSDIAQGLGEYKFTIAHSTATVGTVVIRRHFFDVALRHCTKEEAVIWLALLIAAELETKTPLLNFVQTK